MAFKVCSTTRRHAPELSLATLTACGEKAHMLQPLDESRWGLNGISLYYLLGGMKTAFRFRLYPNHKQERRLLRMIETSRRLWNDALAHRKRRWEEERLSTSYGQQCWILTAERRGDPLLGELYSRQDRRYSDASRGPSRPSSSNGRDTRGSRGSPPHMARSPTRRRTTGR